MSDDGHIGRYARPSGGLVAADPFKNPQEQAHRKGYSAGDDLIFCECGYEGSDGEQGARLQQQTEITNQKRLPVRMAVFKKKEEIQGRKQEHGRVQNDGRKPLAQNNFHIADWRGGQLFDRAGALLFGKEAHGDHGNQEQANDADIGEQRADDVFVDVHRHHLTAHLRFHAPENEETKNVPEEKSKNYGKQRQQDIRNRGNEIAAQLFAENNPDISHLLDSCGYSGFFGGRCGHIAGELQEDFFETDGGGAQFIEVPASFDHGSSEIAANQALAAFHFKDRAVFALVLENDTTDAGNQLQASLHLGRIDETVALANFHQQGFSTASAILQIAYGIGGH